MSKSLPSIKLICALWWPNLRERRAPVGDALLDVIFGHGTEVYDEHVEDLYGDLFHYDQPAAAVVVDRELGPHAGLGLDHVGEQLDAELGVVVELAVELLLLLDDAEALLVDAGEAGVHVRVEEEDVVFGGQLDAEVLLALRRETAEHPHGYLLELLHGVLRPVGLDEVNSEVDVFFEDFLE